MRNTFVCLLFLACMPIAPTAKTVANVGSAEAAVSTRSALPRCDGTESGRIYLVEDERGFVFCDGASWQVLDLRGAPGATGSVGASGATGATGKAGVPGTSSLIKTEDEPAGAHCTQGGTVVYAGVDADGDGVLTEPEYQAESYVCSGAVLRGALPGTYVVNNLVDAALIQEVTQVDSLKVVAVTGVTFPKLETAKSISLEASLVEFPAMKHVDNFQANYPPTADLNISMQADSIAVLADYHLATITVETSGHLLGFSVAGNTFVSKIVAPNVTETDSLEISDTTSDFSFDMPKLTHIGLAMFVRFGMTQCDIDSWLAQRTVDAVSMTDNAACN